MGGQPHSPAFVSPYERDRRFHTDKSGSATSFQRQRWLSISARRHNEGKDLNRYHSVARRTPLVGRRARQQFCSNQMGRKLPVWAKFGSNVFVVRISSLLFREFGDAEIECACVIADRRETLARANLDRLNPVSRNQCPGCGTNSRALRIDHGYSAASRRYVEPGNRLEWHRSRSRMLCRKRQPRPDFVPKVQMLGEPTGTAIDDHERQWWGRCYRKRRPENRLMVRRRDPFGSRQRGPRVRRSVESMLRSRNNIAARLRASRQYQSPDLTGRRGSFTRSSLLCCYRPNSQGRSNSRSY